jgi:hypothetical protein
MRKLLLISLFLTCASGASAQCSSTSYGGGWVCDQGVSFFQNSSSGVASITTNIITPVANNDLIIITSSSCASTTCTVNTPQTITISDNASNSYTCPISNPAVSFGTFFAGAISCYVCRSAGGPTQFTATNSNTAAGSFTRIVVTTWHNTGGTIPIACLDQQSTATFTTGSGTSAAIATTSSTTRNNNLIYSAIDVGGSPGVNNSFVIAQQTVDVVLSAEAKNGATPGSYPTGWTFPSGPWFGDELAFFNPLTGSGVPRKHGIIIKFDIPHYRFPWIPKRKRISTI